MVQDDTTYAALAAATRAFTAAIARSDLDEAETRQLALDLLDLFTFASAHLKGQGVAQQLAETTRRIA